jgi:sugar lactone lactonase YvrE
MSWFTSFILFRRPAGLPLRAFVLCAVLVAGFASAALAGPIVFMNVQTYIQGTAIQGAEGQVNDRAVYSTALSPDGSTLYAGSWTDSWNDPITAYSTANYAIEGTVNYGRCHGGVAVSGNGQYLFATTYYQGNVSRFDLQNGNAQTTQSAGQWPVALRISPDRTTLVAGAGTDGRNYDMNNDAVKIYNVSGNNFSTPVSVPLQDEISSASAIAFSADSSKVYVGTYPRKSANTTLYEVSTASSCGVTRSVELPGVSSIDGVATDGETVFASGRNDQRLWLINENTFSVSGSVDLPFIPGALAMLPDGKHLLVASNGAANYGDIAVLDVGTDSIVALLTGLNPGIQDITLSSDGSTAYLAHGWGTAIGNDGGITVIGITGVPEPSTFVLLGVGASGLLAYAWRKRRGR